MLTRGDVKIVAKSLKNFKQITLGVTTKRALGQGKTPHTCKAEKLPSRT
jgi:hypothetical protein